MALQAIYRMMDHLIDEHIACVQCQVAASTRELLHGRRMSALRRTRAARHERDAVVSTL